MCLGCGVLHAQLALGRIEGVVRTLDGNAMPAVGVSIEGGGLRIVERADADGRFAFVLPYGWYRISLEREPANGFSLENEPWVDVVPLSTVRVALVIDGGMTLRTESALAAEPGEWTGDSLGPAIS